jgi:type IV secretion system protein VirB5
VDKLGQPLAIRRADQATRVDERVVKHLLASLIYDSRTVLSDQRVQNENIWRVYSCLRQRAAAAKITAYMQDENTSPTARSGAFTVSVEIGSVLRESEKSWRVDWIETTFERESGKEISKKRWRALVSIYFLLPTSKTTEQEIQRNPLGIYRGQSRNKENKNGRHHSARCRAFPVA